MNAGEEDDITWPQPTFELSEVDEDHHVEILRQTCADNLEGFKCRTSVDCQYKFQLFSAHQPCEGEFQYYISVFAS